MQHYAASTHSIGPGILYTLYGSITIPDMRQSKTLLTIDERGSKLLETWFSIAICRQSGDKWKSKTLFLTILIRVRR